MLNTNNLPPSDLPETTPENNSENYDFFAFVVDGKVSVVFAADKQYMSQHIAAWSSDPKIVILPEDQKNVVQIGWKYNSESDSFAQ